MQNQVSRVFIVKNDIGIHYLLWLDVVIYLNA